MLNLKLILGLFVLTVTSYAAKNLFSKKFQKASSKDKILKVLFFPDIDHVCVDHFVSKHGCRKVLCKFSHDINCSFAQLIT